MDKCFLNFPSIFWNIFLGKAKETHFSIFNLKFRLRSFVSNLKKVIPIMFPSNVIAVENSKKQLSHQRRISLFLETILVNFWVTKRSSLRKPSLAPIFLLGVQNAIEFYWFRMEVTEKSLKSSITLIFGIFGIFLELFVFFSERSSIKQFLSCHLFIGGKPS